MQPTLLGNGLCIATKFVLTKHIVCMALLSHILQTPASSIPGNKADTATILTMASQPKVAIWTEDWLQQTLCPSHDGAGVALNMRKGCCVHDQSREDGVLIDYHCAASTESLDHIDLGLFGLVNVYQLLCLPE